MTTHELAQLLKQIPRSEIVTFINGLVDARTVESIRTLESLFLVKDKDIEVDKFLKHFISKYSARALLVLQEEGLRILVSLLLQSPDAIYASHILDTIFCASKKIYVQGVQAPAGSSKLLYTPPITDSMARLATELLRDLIIQSQSKSQLFEPFLELLAAHDPKRDKVLYGTDTEFRELWLGTIRESIILLSRATLLEFEQLINISAKEEVYQRFLASNPVLLDPLARRVIPKHQLGREFVTDFVVEKLTGEYVLVEIEKPSDSIFTRKSNFHSRFVHAYGQVLDFQEWSESNISYAQKHLPGITSPAGLLIIGRRQPLTDAQVRKLARFNTTHAGRVTVLCFDDVLDAGNRLYNNMYKDAGI